MELLKAGPLKRETYERAEQIAAVKCKELAMYGYRIDWPDGPEAAGEDGIYIFEIRTSDPIKSKRFLGEICAGLNNDGTGDDKLHAFFHPQYEDDLLLSPLVRRTNARWAEIQRKANSQSRLVLSDLPSDGTEWIEDWPGDNPARRTEQEWG